MTQQYDYVNGYFSYRQKQNRRHRNKISGFRKLRVRDILYFIVYPVLVFAFVNSTVHTKYVQVPVAAHAEQLPEMTFVIPTPKIPSKPTFVYHPDMQVEDIVLSMAKIEFGEDQVYAMQQLIDHESGFDPSAINPSSGACGLFQALPCNKMNSMSVRDQIDFGFSYIKQRYGNPANAWSFWQAHYPNWY